MADIYENKQHGIKISVVTNINLMNFYKKSSDVEAIFEVLNNKDAVFNYQGLHAKFYIFDEEYAIITSANLTGAGLKRNYEYGVLVDDKCTIERICNDFKYLCNSELSGRLNFEHVEEIMRIIASIPKPADIRIPEFTFEAENLDTLFDKNTQAIISNLTGWKKYVFLALQELDKPIFTTDDFKLITPMLAARYPHNHHLEAKIRQQLQQLRDLGLIKFESRGIYKKLWEEN